MAHAAGELAQVAYSSPDRSAKLSGEITTELARYAQVLSALEDRVPEKVKIEIEHTIQEANAKGTVDDKTAEVEISGTVEAVGNGTMTVAGRTFTITWDTEKKGSVQVGDLVKVHLVSGKDGSLAAREVEKLDQPAQSTQVTDDRSTPTPEVGDDKGSGSSVDTNRGSSNSSTSDDHGGTSGGSSSGGSSGSGSSGGSSGGSGGSDDSGGHH